jgi:hypothetical protein
VYCITTLQRDGGRGTQLLLEPEILVNNDD